MRSREWYEGAVAALEEALQYGPHRSAMRVHLMATLNEYRRELAAAPPDPRDEALKVAEEALERVRKGYQNLMEFRQLDNGRYGNLTAEEIESAMEPVTAAIAKIKEVRG